MSRERYTTFYIARESHPNRIAQTILIGRKYNIETPMVKTIRVLNNNLKFFLSATVLIYVYVRVCMYVRMLEKPKY